MELLQLPRSTPAGPRRLASDPTTGENACHPDYHCDRLRHGRVENSLDWKGCRWSLDRSSKGSLGPAPPDQTTNFCSDRRIFYLRLLGSRVAEENCRFQRTERSTSVCSLE